MPPKTRSTKAKAATQTKTAAGLTDGTQKQYEQAIRAGQKLQEKAGESWSQFWGHGALCPPDWQKHFNALTNLSVELLPMARKRMEEFTELVQRSGRTGAALWQKAIEATQTPNPGDSQAKWMDFWTASSKAMQTNVEAVTTLGTKVIDSWLVFIRRNSEIVEVRVPKAA